MSGAREAASGGLRLVLVGATGALGREVLTVLEQASLPIARLVQSFSQGHLVGGELRTQLHGPPGVLESQVRVPGARRPRRRSHVE